MEEECEVGLGLEEVQGGREKNLEERYPGISEMESCMIRDSTAVFYSLPFATTNPLLDNFTCTIFVGYSVGEQLLMQLEYLFFLLTRVRYASSIAFSHIPS